MPAMGVTARTLTNVEPDIVAAIMDVARELGTCTQLLSDPTHHKKSMDWCPSCTDLGAASGRWGTQGTIVDPFDTVAPTIAWVLATLAEAELHE